MQRLGKAEAAACRMVLTPPQRRALRAKAHHLQPVVTIGQHGLTPGVLHEIDVSLRAHELVKIRVFSDERTRREEMLDRICAELDAAPVQHLGKLLIVWRPAPEAAPKAPARPASADAGTARRPGRRSAVKGMRSMAKSAPQARRPRMPMARTPARPPQPGPRATTAKPGDGSRRRRRTQR